MYLESAEFAAVRFESVVSETTHRHRIASENLPTLDSYTEYASSIPVVSIKPMSALWGVGYGLNQRLCCAACVIADN